jgi:hypoxanthine phosphoribosyltransferase
VLVVDEICGSGETIRMVKEKAAAMGAAQIRSAVLYAHSWGIAIPDYIGLITDALILNPWDREILQDGEFHFHPEYVAALAQQNLQVEPHMLIPATPFKLAKG